MILSNIINVNTRTATAKFILYAILERAEYVKSNTFFITQTYIAKLCATSTKTVARELQYLQEQGYITYNKALYNNLTTTQITLTEKSIALISRPQDTQNKTQETAQTQAVNKTICNNKKTQETALKQAAEGEKENYTNSTEAEETADAHKITFEEMYKQLNSIQKSCVNVLLNAKTEYPFLYIQDAQEQGVPEVLINFALEENKRRKTMQK